MSVGRAWERGWLAGLALVVALCGLAPPAGAAWSWRAQGLTGFGYDTNPREAVRRALRRGDGFARLETALTLRRAFAKGQVGAGLRWGADRYAEQRAETRHGLRAEVSGSLVLGRWGWQVQASHQERSYPHAAERTHRREELRLLGERPAGARGRWEGEVAASWLEREPGGGIASRSRRGGEAEARWRRGWGVRWETLLAVALAHVRHERPALERRADGEVRVCATHQRDRLWRATIGIARSGAPAWRLSCSYERTRSNSEGVGFERLRLGAGAEVLLPGSVSLHLLTAWHPWRRYAEETRLVDPYADPEDPEFGERNGVTMRLLRPLGRGLRVEVEGGWQRNEFALLRDYYERTFLTLSMRYHASR